MVRRELRVLGSRNWYAPSIRCNERWMVSVAVSNSTSCHRRPSASDWRSPQARATVNNASSRSPCTASSNPLAAVGVSAWTSRSGMCGGSANDATLRPTRPCRMAMFSVRLQPYRADWGCRRSLRASRLGPSRPDDFLVALRPAGRPPRPTWTGVRRSDGFEPVVGLPVGD